MDRILVTSALIAYMLAFALNLFRIVSRSETCSKWGSILVLIGWLLHTAGIIARWHSTYEAGFNYFPVTDRYESLVFFSWCVALAWIVIRRWMPGPGFGAGMQFCAALLLASGGLADAGSGEVGPLMPALRSNWLIFHVVTCFLAYAAFAASAFIAVHFIHRTSRSTLPENDVVRTDSLMYRIVSVGFFLLTLGILSGSAWAQQSWGRYWGWDPKETWSLITWILYALFLHARVVRGWSGRRLAFIVILGFLAVLFTYFGVNYLPTMKGLHSYA